MEASSSKQEMKEKCKVKEHKIRQQARDGRNCNLQEQESSEAEVRKHYNEQASRRKMPAEAWPGSKPEVLPCPMHPSLALCLGVSEAPFLRPGGCFFGADFLSDQKATLGTSCAWPRADPSFFSNILFCCGDGSVLEA